VVLDCYLWLRTECKIQYTSMCATHNLESWLEECECNVFYGFKKLCLKLHYSVVRVLILP